MAISDFVSMWEAGGQAGRDARTRRTLADYAQPALQGDQDALKNIYAVDPDAGYKVQGMAREQREQDYGDLVRVAQYYQQTGDPNAYGVLREQAARLGPQFAGLPASIDTDEDRAGSMKFAEAISQSFGSGQGGATVRSSYINDAGYRVALMSDGSERVLGKAEARTQVYNSADGAQMLDMRSGQYRPFVPQGTQQFATPLQFVGQDGKPVSIDPSLPPEVQRSIAQQEGAWANAPQGATAQLPPTAAQSAAPLRPYRAPASPEEQMRLQMDAERLRLQQESAAREAAKDQREMAQGPKLDEAERSAAGYKDRMVQAEQILGEVERQGYEPGNYRDYLGANNAGLPIIGPAFNAVTSPLGQQYRQAQEDWVRAKLRRESGAVIGDEEMAREIRQYFPQPGDNAATVAQKARARAQAIQQLDTMAGRAGTGSRPAQPAPQSQQAAPAQAPRPSGARRVRYNPATGAFEE